MHSIKDEGSFKSGEKSDKNSENQDDSIIYNYQFNSQLYKSVLTNVLIFRGCFMFYKRL